MRPPAVRTCSPSSPPPTPSAPQPSTSAVPVREHAQTSWPAVERVRALLRAVPAPPPHAKPPPLRNRLAHDLEHDLVQHRRACAEIHRLLLNMREPTTPPDRKGKARAREEDEVSAQIPPWVQREVVSLVAKTMRLHLHMGHVASAEELDRAFFTLAPHFSTADALRRRRLGRIVKEKKNRRRVRLQLGAGLGLSRGDEGRAWMQSIAVRLAGRAGDARALERLFALLRSFRASTNEGGQAAGGGMSGRSHVLAFLARQMGELRRRAARAKHRLPMRRLEAAYGELRLLMGELRRAEEDEGGVVALALLDTSVQRLEKTREVDLDDPLYQKVESDVERLVASLGDVFEGLDGAPGRSRAPSPTQLERRAEALYLAIRFLILRAQVQSPRDYSTRAPVPPLVSASQLYLLLLDLTLPVASSPSLAHTALARLRLRQTSALYRLVAAHLAALAAAQHRRPHAQDADPPLAPLAALQSLLSRTLDVLAGIPPPAPPATRHIGLSTHTLREVLLVLGRAFDPARPARKTALPSFEVVREALETLLACREADATLHPATGSEPTPASAPPERANSNPQRARDEVPLLRREDAAAALARAALLAESDSAADVRARLEWVLEWVARLQRASPLRERGWGTFERKARGRVAQAVKGTIERAWEGEGGREWREGVLRRVGEWVEEGEREWGARVESHAEEGRSGEFDAQRPEVGAPPHTPSAAPPPRRLSSAKVHPRPPLALHPPSATLFAPTARSPQ